MILLINNNQKYARKLKFWSDLYLRAGLVCFYRRSSFDEARLAVTKFAIWVIKNRIGVSIYRVSQDNGSGDESLLSSVDGRLLLLRRSLVIYWWRGRRGLVIHGRRRRRSLVIHGRRRRRSLVIHGRRRRRSLVIHWLWRWRLVVEWSRWRGLAVDGLLWWDLVVDVLLRWVIVEVLLWRGRRLLGVTYGGLGRAVCGSSYGVSGLSLGTVLLITLLETKYKYITAYLNETQGWF